MRFRMGLCVGESLLACSVAHPLSPHTSPSVVRADRPSRKRRHTVVVPPSRPLLLVPGVGGSRLCARRRGSAAPPIDVYFRFWRPDTTFQEFLFSRWDEAAGEIVPVNPDVEVRCRSEAFVL